MIISIILIIVHQEEFQVQTQHVQLQKAIALVEEDSLLEEAGGGSFGGGGGRRWFPLIK